MLDTFIILTPILVLAIVALLGLVGCNPIEDFSTPPAPAPGNFTGRPGDQKAFITWEDSHYYSSYKVKRRIPPSTSFTTVANLPAGSSSYTDPDLTNGTTYVYVMTGDWDGDDSRNSPEVSVTPAPITFVQIAESNETQNNNSVATGAFGNLSQGNLVVVWIWYESNTAQVAGVMDSASNVYQRAAGPTQGGGALSGYRQEIWFATNVNGGGGVQVTAAFSAVFNAKKVISAHEYSGAALMDTVGVSASATGANANPSSGTANVAEVSLVFGAAIFSSSATAGPGFTQRSSIESNVTEDKRAEAPGPIAATFTAPGPEDWIAQMVTFR